jgi:hypothetical protein
MEQSTETLALVTLLRAGLGEDERVARAALEWWDGDREAGYFEWPSREGSSHVLRHDPARVLREVAAKRKLIDLYEAQIETGGFVGTLYGNAADPALRLLALPYTSPDGEVMWRGPISRA